MGGDGDLISQLERLAALKDSGHITEGEFAAQKAALLRKSDSSLSSAESRSEHRSTANYPILLAVGSVSVIALVAVGFAAWINRAPHPVAQPISSTAGAVDVVSSASLTSSNPTIAPPAHRLDRIFSPDVIGENVRYLESITGPPLTSEKYTTLVDVTNTYKIDGCNVIVGIKDAAVENIGIDNYSTLCQFDIGQYFGQDMVGEKAVERVVPFPTFGQLDQGLGGDYTADCLSICGNAADPTVSLEYEGSHADNWNQMIATVALVNGDSLTASEEWAAKLDQRYGKGYSDSLDPKKDNLNDVAAAAFRAVRPTSIRVGLYLIPGAN